MSGHLPPMKCLAPIVPTPDAIDVIELGKNDAAVIWRPCDGQWIQRNPILDVGKPSIHICVLSLLTLQVIGT